MIYYHVVVVVELCVDNNTSPSEVGRFGPILVVQFRDRAQQSEISAVTARIQRNKQREERRKEERDTSINNTR